MVGEVTEYCGLSIGLQDMGSVSHAATSMYRLTLATWGADGTTVLPGASGSQVLFSFSGGLLNIAATFDFP